MGPGEGVKFIADRPGEHYTPPKLLWPGMHSPRDADRGAVRWIDSAAILLLIIALHWMLARTYPVIYGGDTILRLAHHDKLRLAYQLPLFQALLHLALGWRFDALAVWILMGAISGTAGAALYLLARALGGARTTGLIAAALYTSHPFILFYSRVPYQESLLLSGILWGFYFLLQPASARTNLAASLALGAACLTRYEGWIASGAGILYRVAESRRSNRSGVWASLLRSVLLLGWGPLLWVLWNRGLSPEGTFLLNLDWQWGRLYRPFFLLKTTAWWTDAATSILALLGFTLSVLPGEVRRQPRTWILPAFLLAYLAATCLSAHGIEPDPERLVTERAAYVPIALLLGYAALGWKAIDVPLLRSSLWSKALGAAILIYLAGYNFNRAEDRIRAANDAPDLKTDYEVGRFLASRQAGALILARPLPHESVENYLSRAERFGGPRGRAAAEQILGEIGTRPFDYQRILVHSWLGKGRIFSSDALRGRSEAEIEKFISESGIGYLVVLSDWSAASPEEAWIHARFARDSVVEAEIRNGSTAALVYRVRISR